MHAVPSSLKGKYVIRYTVTSPRTTLNDIARDWEIIQQFSTEVLAGDMEVVSTSTTRTRMPLKGYLLLIAYKTKCIVVMSMEIPSPGPGIKKCRSRITNCKTFLDEKSRDIRKKPVNFPGMSRDII